MTYSRFMLMIAVSTIVMFGLMYLNTYAWDHIFFSETRGYAALYMGASMAIIMLAFMLGMYTNRRLNIAILLGSVLIFVTSLFLLRSQTTVDDVDYMKAMIPHHSIAILTSERAKLVDPRVRKMADGIMPDHICPYGLKTKALLERKGYDVEDNWLETRDETDAFQKQYDVKTTPQTFINQQRIGGYDDVRRFFGHHFPQEGETSYRPIIVLFSMAFFLAVAVTWMSATPVATITFLERFVAIAMCLLAVQKLQDVEGFSTMFLNYDLLARRYVPYGYIYPFAEAAAQMCLCRWQQQRPAWLCLTDGKPDDGIHGGLDAGPPVVAVKLRSEVGTALSSAPKSPFLPESSFMDKKFCILFHRGL